MNAFCTENEFGVKCNTSANISTWGNDQNDLVDPFEIPEEFAEELIHPSISTCVVGWTTNPLLCT